MNTQPKFQSVIEALDHWREICPDRPYCTFQDFKGKEEKITFQALYEEARATAQWFQTNGLKRGDRVVLAVPNGRSFLTGFLGTLMAGGVAVPVVCRDSILKGLNKAAESLGHVFRDSAAKYVLTTNSNQSVCEEAMKDQHQKPVVSLIEKLPKKIQLDQDPLKIFPEDIAFIQYTSGSTSLPKGVVIRHHQLVAQIESIAHGLKSNVKDCAVSWLPLFHDMGLIGTFLHSLYVGMKLVLMSPEKFLFDPKQWLLAISKYKATMSTGPNSAYSMCLSRIRPEDLKGVDLSTWRVAFSGAEPIHVSTMKNFIERYQANGFQPGSIVAGYGMAENCLAISFRNPGDGLKYDVIDRASFENLHIAKPALQDASSKTLSFVSCGKPVLNHEVAIIGDSDQLLSERCVGEVVVRGPSVMDGYFQKECETKKTIRNNWLYTGDMGYLAEGEIYIVGRKKDMIIKGGRNYCPQDIETAAETVEGVRKGCIVAFGVHDEAQGTEKIILAVEIKKAFIKGKKEISRKIQAQVMAASGLSLDEVVILPPHVLTKTTSGKIQRASCKQRYLAGTLDRKITLWDRFQYFRFRTLLFISMSFYFLSAIVRKRISRGKR